MFETLAHCGCLARRAETTVRLVIEVQSVYAKEWLEHRLRKVIERTVSSIARSLVRIVFEVLQVDLWYFSGKWRIIRLGWAEGNQG